jgi:addiction module HigA family antidote
MGRKQLLTPIHPGEILLEEFMKPLGIASTGSRARSPFRTAASAPSSMGKRSITADTALRLSKYFGVSSDLWLGLQADFDLRGAKRTVGREIDKRVRHRVA